ncbi:hypothetical protein V1286_000780 [Bradyrhizobium algeriense]|uniref:Transposase n=1 Tax=Bradyrhizobium algeriense TaxID=634784 RepID=A0ABU8B583_9BRAD
MAELSEAINLDEIAVGLPGRSHKVTARQAAEAPTGSRWSRTGKIREHEIAACLHRDRAAAR